MPIESEILPVEDSTLRSFLNGLEAWNSRHFASSTGVIDACEVRPLAFVQQKI